VTAKAALVTGQLLFQRFQSRSTDSKAARGHGAHPLAREIRTRPGMVGVAPHWAVVRWRSGARRSLGRAPPQVEDVAEAAPTVPDVSRRGRRGASLRQTPAPTARRPAGSPAAAGTSVWPACGRTGRGRSECRTPGRRRSCVSATRSAARRTPGNLPGGAGASSSTRTPAAQNTPKSVRSSLLSRCEPRPRSHTRGKMGARGPTVRGPTHTEQDGCQGGTAGKKTLGSGPRDGWRTGRRGRACPRSACTPCGTPAPRCCSWRTNRLKW
jgi:hypothetical protein